MEKVRTAPYKKEKNIDSKKYRDILKFYLVVCRSCSKGFRAIFCQNCKQDFESRYNTVS